MQAHIVDRAYDPDPRRQRSFIFNFDYYTVIGEDCAPMPWQLTDIIPKKTGEHIPIARCSSVVGLSLAGECIKKFEATHRRSKTQHGFIYDPWAPVCYLLRHCKGGTDFYSGMFSISSAILIISIPWTPMIPPNTTSMEWKHSWQRSWLSLKMLRRGLRKSTSALVNSSHRL